MGALTRKERERAEHRRQMLEAAEAVFAEKGYHEAGVQEIADRAECSVGYLYNLFENKTDLYGELIDLRAAEFIADVRERMAAQDGALAKLQAAIVTKVEFFRRRKQFFRIHAQLHTSARVEGPMALPVKARERYRAYMEDLAAVFSQGIRDGVVVDLDPTVLVQCLEGLTNSAIAQWVHKGSPLEDLPEAEILQRVFFEGILARRVPQ